MVSQQQADTRRGIQVTVRKYTDADVAQLAALDKRCEMGAAGSESLAFDLLGDPLCRVRHLPTFHMLVSKVLRALQSRSSWIPTVDGFQSSIGRQTLNASNLGIRGAIRRGLKVFDALKPRWKELPTLKKLNSQFYYYGFYYYGF